MYFSYSHPQLRQLMECLGKSRRRPSVGRTILASLRAIIIGLYQHMYYTPYQVDN